jgi:hypothetical protein
MGKDFGLGNSVQLKKVVSTGRVVELQKMEV